MLHKIIQFIKNLLSFYIDMWQTYRCHGENSNNKNSAVNIYYTVNMS